MKAPRFSCQECGHSFRSVQAAERASLGPEGCPECGGSDIDEADPTVAKPVPSAPAPARAS